MQLARFFKYFAVVQPLLFCVALPAQTLPGTTAWQMPADPAKEMVEGIHRQLDKMLADSA